MNCSRIIMKIIISLPHNLARFEHNTILHSCCLSSFGKILKFLFATGLGHLFLKRVSGDEKYES